MKKLAIMLGLGIILALPNMFAQSNYTYDLKKDLVIGSVALGIFVTPFFFNNTSDNAVFNPNAINAFDRAVMFPYHKNIDTLSQIGAYGLLILPAVSLIGNITDLNAVATYGVMYAEAFLLTYGTKEMLKNAIIRYRPYCYYGDIPSGKETDYDDSFPSGHTSLAFMSAGFFTSTFFTEYPDSTWKLPIAGVSYVLATAVAASRIYSGNHFLTDVIAGAAIGSLYGYLIPWLHLKKQADTAIAFTPLPNGFVFSYRF
jgi:membrane-associated phospholipid phosphatase